MQDGLVTSLKTAGYDVSTASVEHKPGRFAEKLDGVNGQSDLIVDAVVSAGRTEDIGAGEKAHFRPVVNVHVKLTRPGDTSPIMDKVFVYDDATLATPDAFHIKGDPQYDIAGLQRAEGKNIKVAALDEDQGERNAAGGGGRWRCYRPQEGGRFELAVGEAPCHRQSPIQTAAACGLSAIWKIRSALALAEVGDGAGKVGAVEVRPHALGEPQFGESAFPEQEVRQALVAAGADQQIDIGGFVIARAGLGDQTAEAAGVLVPARRGGLDRLARGIVDGDADMQPSAVGRRRLDPGQGLRGGSTQAGGRDDRSASQARAALDQHAGVFGLQIVAQQPHQTGHFTRRPQPVV